MDKNQSIGLVLMFGLLAVYFMFFAEQPKIEETQKQNKDKTTELVKTIPDSTAQKSIQVATTMPDSIINQLNQEKYGVFSNAAGVADAETTIENENLVITFSNKGGKIKSVVLKKHNDYLAEKGDKFKIMNPVQSNMDFIIELPEKDLNLSELAFSPNKTMKNDTTILTFSLTGGNSNLQYQYAIPPKGNEIFHQVIGENLPASMKRSNVKFAWNHGASRGEERINDERNNTNVRFYSKDGYDELKEQTNDFVEEKINSPIKWISFKQKFFNAGIIADNSFESAYVSAKGNENDSSVVKQMVMQVELGKALSEGQFGLKYYFGSNRYNAIKNVATSYSENLDMGWGPLPLVNKFLIIPIFNSLQKILSSYGLIILILVLIIRFILAPLTYKSHMSMARMKVLKPELDEIKEKHPDEPQKAQQAQMKLYQQLGINPLSGCIPMLLQMPILFSLFFFFPNSVELRQQSFLWAHDLSTYDSIIKLPFGASFDHLSLFTLMMTISTLLYTWSNNQMSSSAALQGPAKNIQYLMPIIFLFVLNSYAAGLTFYYFISNMFSFGQMMLFRKLVDEDKIKAKLEENRKKNANKKKSKFQQRLDDAMKASQENQKKRKK